MSTVERGPYEGVRVLDLTDELAVNGTRLLAGLGAEVVRPEPPEGDAIRSRPPFARARQGDHAESLAHIVYNAGKRCVRIEANDEGFARVRALAEAADAVILTSTSPYAPAFQPSPLAWSGAHPGVVFVYVEPFERESPFAGKPFTDLTIAAASGFDWYCGSADGTPEHPKGQLALGYTGIAAAGAVAVGLAARAYGNSAGWFELTAQEAFAFAALQSGDPNPLRWHGQLPSRVEWGATAARSLHRCRDGKWLTFVMLGAHFDDFAAWLDREGITDKFRDERWLEREYYLAHQEEITEAIAELCRKKDRDEVVREGQDLGLMVMPLSSISDLLADEHFAARRMFREVETCAGTLRLPRAPVVFSGTPVPDPGRAECVASTVDAKWEPRERPSANGKADLPLTGMRIADFTWMLAAPVATRVLADMGADVIRIESHARRDMTREIGPQPPNYFSLDTNSTQHHANSNKRSIALNLSKPEAVELAREIIATSDIVFENYTPGTMARWGLEPEALLRERPDLIVVSQPAVGYTGPHRHWGAIGNGVAGYGGLNMLTGFPANPPFGVGPIVSDLIAPFVSLTATLAAVEHRRRTGQGQHVDCGMVEATLWMLDTAYAETQLSGRNPEQTGNRSAWMSPHGIFPARGSDEWIAIAARNDAEWAATAKVLGLPDLAHDERFTTLEARKRNEDRLEEYVSRATSRWDRWELAQALLAAGVPAAPVETIRDHLERDHGTRFRYATIQHPYGFEFLVINQFIRPNGRTVPNRRAPMIGEHSDQILREVLGKTDDEVAALTVDGVIY